MLFSEFKKLIIQSGLSFEEFTCLLGEHSTQWANYANAGEVPESLGLLAFSLREWSKFDPSLHEKIYRFASQAKQKQFSFSFLNVQNKVSKELPFPEQIKAFPKTRFMGSKQRLLPSIYKVVKELQFDSVLDLFAGSGIVGYLFKSMGKQVICNDYMEMNYLGAKALVENNSVTLPKEEARKLLDEPDERDHFVEENFKGIYYSDRDTQIIDRLRFNIHAMEDSYKKDIAFAALFRAALKKRPRGIFTYSGLRYQDGRKDLSIPISQHFLQSVDEINKAVFDNERSNLSLRSDALALQAPETDLVYLDPPYCSLFSDNEYVRRYHFLEGLAINWQGVQIQTNTKTKKFKSYPTPFATKKTVYRAFEELFDKFRSQTLLISYSSNSLPSEEEMISLLENAGKKVEIFPIDISYSFGNQVPEESEANNGAQEFLFLAY